MIINSAHISEYVIIPICTASFLGSYTDSGPESVMGY